MFYSVFWRFQSRVWLHHRDALAFISSANVSLVCGPKKRILSFGCARKKPARLCSQGKHATGNLRRCPQPPARRGRAPACCGTASGDGVLKAPRSETAQSPIPALTAGDAAAQMKIYERHGRSGGRGGVRRRGEEGSGGGGGGALLHTDLQSRCLITGAF